jgi:hypothetical protein
MLPLAACIYGIMVDFMLQDYEYSGLADSWRNDGTLRQEEEKQRF